MNSSIDAHQLLETLSTQPIASAGFPSHFSIAIQIRNAITNENMSLKNISEIIRKDPLVATKVVRTANSALFAGSATLTDIERSINRIGLDAVKRIVLGVTMLQLARCKEMLGFGAYSRKIWLHSMYTASAASTLTRQETRYNENEAFYLGLIFNMGAFYMLYQSTIHPVLRDNLDDVLHAVERHYFQRTLDILKFLHVPSDVVELVAAHKHMHLQEQGGLSRPEVLYIANAMASAKYPWLEDRVLPTEVEPYLTHSDTIETLFKQVRAEFKP